MLRELCALRNGLAHLASCQAATLEDLPKSASKRQRTRHESICTSANQFLQGDDSGIRYITSLEGAKNRCTEAVISSMLKYGPQS